MWVAVLRDSQQHLTDSDTYMTAASANRTAKMLHSNLVRTALQWNKTSDESTLSPVATCHTLHAYLSSNPVWWWQLPESAADCCKAALSSCM